MKFKTYPFSHQLEEFETSKDLKARALFWEMGVGKSWVAINTAAHLYLKGEIDALIVVAPSGVHHNWHVNELPEHMPVEYYSMAWSTKRSRTQKHRQEYDTLTKHSGLRVLLISYDSVMTKLGAEAVKNLITTHRCMLVADESQRIKTPSAKRTRRMLAMSKYTPYKRILTGTPITNSPFDIYTQIKFLDYEFWNTDFRSYEAFKTTFGIFEPRIVGNRRFKVCTKFKNLGLLNRLLAPISSRLTKEEALDLPPKIYSRLYFELSPDQKKAYEDLREEFLLELSKDSTVTAPLIITRLVRFQQIVSGFVKDDEGKIVPFKENPRLKATLDHLQDIEGKIILFAKFRFDIDELCRALGDQAVRYDGAVGDDARAEAVERFQNDPSIRYFVGNPAACGEGLNLTSASTVVWYSATTKLGEYLQASDRPHRIGQIRPVLYVHIISKNSIDEKITQALIQKRNMASEITGDTVKEWI